MKKKSLFALGMALTLCACTLLGCTTPNNDNNNNNNNPPAKHYDIKSVTVEGVSLTDFELYTPSYTKKHFANQDNVFDLTLLQENVEYLIGEVLPIATIKVPTKRYIVVEPVGVSESEYEIEIKDGNIHIKGSYNSVQVAIDYLIEDYMQSFQTENVVITNDDDIKVTGNKKQIYSKQDLMTVLKDVYNDNDHLIVGQQMEGRKFPSYTLELFEEETDQLPGILGMDLGMQGYGSSPLEWNEADFSRYVSEVVDYTANGGIYTVSVHYDNPSKNYTGADASNENWCKGVLGYTDTVAGYEQAFADLITDGTELNTEFKKELDANAQFLKALKEHGVPILFRPLHEMNGTWFWWNSTQNGKTVSADCYANLWRWLHDYYTNTWGLDNLVWVYSPNVSAGNVNGGMMSTLYNYPGDEYVDIVGVDWYTNTRTMEIENGNCYQNMVEQSGKIGAVCEFGPSEPSGSTAAQDKYYNMMDAYDDLVDLMAKGYKLSYFMTWTDSIMCGITSMGHGYEFMEDEFTLGQAEVYELFQEVKK